MMRRLFHPLLVASAFVATAVAWPRLPARMPVHWNLAGEVDRVGSRAEGALIMPAMMLLIWGLMRVLPTIDPRRANYARMAGTYELVITITLLSLLALHGVLLATALGYPIAIDVVTPLLVGMMFVALGNVLPRAKPNWWFGVRTPWTLSNDRVWMRTHRVAGYSMVLAGLALMAVAFVPAPPARIALIAVAIAVALVPVVYSYVAWRQESASR